MKVGFLPSTQPQVGAHQAGVRGRGHLAQVAHQGLFVVHVDDGVSDHPRRIGSRDRRPDRYGGQGAVPSWRVLMGHGGCGSPAGGAGTSSGPAATCNGPIGTTQPRSWSRVRAPATTAADWPVAMTSAVGRGRAVQQQPGDVPLHAAQERQGIACVHRSPGRPVAGAPPPRHARSSVQAQVEHQLVDAHQRPCRALTQQGQAARRRRRPTDDRSPRTPAGPAPGRAAR